MRSLSIKPFSMKLLKRNCTLRACSASSSKTDIHLRAIFYTSMHCICMVSLFFYPAYFCRKIKNFLETQLYKLGSRSATKRQTASLSFIHIYTVHSVRSSSTEREVVSPGVRFWWRGHNEESEREGFVHSAARRLGVYRSLSRSLRASLNQVNRDDGGAALEGGKRKRDGCFNCGRKEGGSVQTGEKFWCANSSCEYYINLFINRMLSGIEQWWSLMESLR